MESMLLCVGKLKEKYWREAANEYIKRLKRFTQISEVEIPDLPEPANASLAEQAKVLKQEGEALLQKIKPGDYVVALAIEGKNYTSPGFSEFLQNQKHQGRRLVLVIGGSLGLAPQVLQRADSLISFSPMTFPHQLARVMLLEQWYRGESRRRLKK